MMKFEDMTQDEMDAGAMWSGCMYAHRAVDMAGRGLAIIRRGRSVCPGDVHIWSVEPTLAGRRFIGRVRPELEW